MTSWFTSDTHFGHANIIRYCNRPYESASHMNDDLIAKWNARVQPGDTVYHLGDFGFAHEDAIDGILKRLNGSKFLIFGNHDKVLKKHKFLQGHFVECVDYKEIVIQDRTADRGRQSIVMFHYPLIVWNKSHHGSWMLHGHSHHTLKYPFEAKILDVGVDGRSYDYSPISYEAIRTIMAKKKYSRPVDHHGDHIDSTPEDR